MEICKNMILRELKSINEYRAHANLVAELLESCPNVKMQEELAVLDKKITVITCWLQLLTDNEMFVIQKHVIDGLEISRVAQAFTERWGHTFFRSERTITSYQTSAIRKMIRFSNKYRAEVTSIFNKA